MGFWDGIKRLFQRSSAVEIEEDLRNDLLDYTGDEPNCWACELPIHKTHRVARLNKKIVHRKCFRKMKRIALNGGKIDEFFE